MLRKLRIVALLAFAAGATGGLPARALEWRSAHSLTAQANSDSNLHLSAAAPDNAQYANVSAQADVVARRPGLSFRFAPEVRAVRYAQDAQEDRSDMFATLGLGLDDVRRSASFDANYGRESTLTSEFETSGLRGDVERVQSGLNAAFSRTLSATRSLAFTVSSVDTDYGSAPVTLYGDYAQQDAQLSHRVATKHGSWGLVASKSFVEASFGAGDSTTTALSSSWSLRLSPRLQGTFGIGAFVVDSVSAESEDPSASFNLGLTRQWLRWSLSGSAGRDVRPQSGGAVVVEEAVTLTAQWAAGERVSVSIHLRGAETSSAVDRFFEYHRTYSSAGAALNWQFARRLELSASVSERAEASSLTPRASGLVGVVSLTYRGG